MPMDDKQLQKLMEPLSETEVPNSVWEKTQLGVLRKSARINRWIPTACAASVFVFAFIFSLLPGQGPVMESITERLAEPQQHLTFDPPVESGRLVKFDSPTQSVLKFRVESIDQRLQQPASSHERAQLSQTREALLNSYNALQRERDRAIIRASANSSYNGGITYL